MSLKAGSLAILALLVILPFTVLSFPGEVPRASLYSFDRDGDGIDDILEGGGPFDVIIHTDSKETMDPIISELEIMGGTVESRYSLVNAFGAVLPDMRSLKKVASMEGILVIEAQRELEFLMDTSVPATKASPSSAYSPQTAHDLGYTGKGVTIAVIDTGVDNEHPMLEGSFVAGADFSLPDTPLTPRDGSFDPDDRVGHGTGVASIALGREVDGVVGVAPDAGLIDLKLGSTPATENSPRTADLLEALEWCSDYRETDWGNGYSGVDIVSLSLEIIPGDGSNSLALDALVAEGIVIVQGAGNSAGPYDEQTDTSWSDRSIIVGGIDHQGTVVRSDDRFWSGSTSGPRTDDGDDNPIEELKPDVTVPAVDLSFASHSTTSNLQGASGMSSGSGTSFATPHVSGVVALMLEANPSIKPDGEDHPVKRILHQSAEPRGDPTFPGLSDTYNANYGWGILDAYQAVLAARSYTGVNHRPMITSFTVNPDTMSTGSTATVRVVATDIDEDPLTYTLEVDDGEVSGEGPEWQWTAPDEPGSYSFLVTVEDSSGASDQQRTDAEVIEGTPNRPPVITSYNADKRTLGAGESTRITVVAFDQDGDPLTYEYFTITGSISGQGEEVTYTAPGNPGTDTVTVIVSDPSDASDQRDLTITVVDDATNSPPSILLLDIGPEIITANETGADIILTAAVEDPDGYSDIDLVIADLTSLGGSDGERMFDDGSYPDNSSGDGTFSLLVQLPETPFNGLYTIEVTVFDSSGEEASDTIDLMIDIKAAGNVSSGGSSGPDLLLVFIGLGAILLIVVIVVIFVLTRRKKTQAPPGFQQHPYYPQVRYRPSSPGSIPNPSGNPPIQVGPSSQARPRFNVVSNR